MTENKTLMQEAYDDAQRKGAEFLQVAAESLEMISAYYLGDGNVSKEQIEERTAQVKELVSQLQEAKDKLVALVEKEYFNVH